ncbi:Membrane transport protein MMPL domain-containing protein [Smaragdicoccus niigatensis]
MKNPFVWLADTVVRWPFVVIALLASVALSFGLYGHDLDSRLSQEGWFNTASDSVKGSLIADKTFGRDTDGDIIALYTAPPGHTVDEPQYRDAAQNLLDNLKQKYPKQILKVDSYWDYAFSAQFADPTRQHAFASIGLNGGGGTKTLEFFRDVRSGLEVPGLKVQLAGLQPVVDALNVGMQEDIKRAEMIAMPLVAILLFFVFGGAIAAILPVMVGVLTVFGARGIMRIATEFTEVNAFANAVVTLISMALAIDYGLLMVSRFREEIAEGATPAVAVQRAVRGAGRTILFSSSIIAVCMAGLFIYPMGVARSMPYGTISTVVLAAIFSVTVLPAVLYLLGPRIDSLSIKKFSRTRTAAQIDAGIWSRMAVFAMKRPKLMTVGLSAFLIILATPFSHVTFGGIGVQYLSEGSPTRVAQEDFDRIFPNFRTEPVKLVIVGASNEQLSEIRAEANAVGGISGGFEATEPTKDGVNVLAAGLVERDAADFVVHGLREIAAPPGVTIYVAGVPTLERDAINGLIDRLPYLLGIMVLASFALMMVAFGSVWLALRAIIMSGLSLGSALGVLAWIFHDGHLSGLIGFTPGPLMFPVVVMIVTCVFGLSTDYELFLMSRMVEAHDAGADTREAIRYGTAHTGGVIAAAAAILIVVTGAFAFSDLVIMKCIAYGLIAALILDATIIRMLLVPALMMVVGDRTWGKRPLPAHVVEGRGNGLGQVEGFGGESAGELGGIPRPDDRAGDTTVVAGPGQSNR